MTFKNFARDILVSVLLNYVLFLSYCLDAITESASRIKVCHNERKKQEKVENVSS